jgi:hypothetical protein
MYTRLVLAIALALFLTGCKKNDDSIPKKVGSGVGGAVTDFVSGVGAGVDEKNLVNVELTQDLLDKGVSSTIAKEIEIEQGKKGITVYFLSRDPVEVKLLTKALDKEGLEIGRGSADFKAEKGDGKYVSFSFPTEMDRMMVKKYQVSLAP